MGIGAFEPANMLAKLRPWRRLPSFFCVCRGMSLPTELRATIASTAIGRASLFVAAATFSIALAFAPVLLHSGWPHNHEHLGWVTRIRHHSEALYHGDFLPIWQADGCEGLGSAMPLFYHRLFNLVAGALYLLCGSIKSAVCAALAIFAFVGILGLMRTCLVLNAGWRIATLVAITFPHWNYARTDWLVRGAFAEFSALCLCPWLLWWCVDLLVKRRFSLTISAILLGVYLAHSPVAYFALPQLAIAYFLHLSFHRPPLLGSIARLMLSALTFSVAVAPFLILMLQCAPQTNVDYFRVYLPWQLMLPVRCYFWDKPYSWGREFEPYTVQLDAFFLGSCALFALSQQWRYKATLLLPPARTQWPLLLFASCSFVCYFVLQTRLAHVFYRLAPGAEYLQFPWRLLCFLSPLLVLAVVLLGLGQHGAPSAWRQRILAMACLATIALNSSRTIRYSWFSSVDLESPRNCNWAEYAPLRLQGQKRIGLTFEEQKRLRDEGPVALGAAAEIDELHEDPYLERRYRVNCRQQTEVALPLAYSPLERVFLECASGLIPLAHTRTDGDPRIRVRIPPGANIIRVQLPTMRVALTRGHKE